MGGAVQRSRIQQSADMSAVCDLKRRISEETVKGFKSVGNGYVNLKLSLEAEQLVSMAEQPMF